MKKQIILITLALIAVLVSVSAVSAANIYVNTTGNDTSGTGTADNPFLTIQKGYDTSANGDTVIIANGTYSGTGNNQIHITNNINITGQSQTGTIIDGTGNLIFIIGGTVSIQNLTIVKANDPIVNNGQLTVKDCTFKNNTANGGAIHNENQLTVTDSTFINNTALQFGGAIDNCCGSTIITGCTFNDNRAPNGGAIYHNESNGIKLIVNNSIFNNNTATHYGGAISCNGNVTVNNCTFTGNNATGAAGGPSGDGGGAIYNSQNGNCTVTNSKMISNNATIYGGGIFNNGGTLTVTNCNILQNIAEVGGGINNFYGSCNVTNSKINNNIAHATAGGINNYHGTCILTHSNFIGNTAIWGGAIYNSVSVLNVTGCNFDSNTGTHSNFLWNGGGSSAILRFNRIYNPGGNEVNNTDTEALDAMYNWWGSNSNPSSKLQGNVLYDPWLMLNIYSDPSTIYTGQTSTITANVYKDSAGNNHSADAAQFFSGPQVTFTSTLGTIGSYTKTVDWVLGQAVRTYTGILAGKDPITANDGDQTVSTTVTVLQAPTANAASNTVGMQETGLPIAGLILAALALFGGLATSKRK